MVWSKPRTSIGLSERISRSVSTHGRLSMSVARIGRSSIASPLSSYTDPYDDTRSLITRSFAPAVAIYASPDTDELARGKSFRYGFRDLVRPSGEKVTGKVVKVTSMLNLPHQIPNLHRLSFTVTTFPFTDPSLAHNTNLHGRFLEIQFDHCSRLGTF